MGAAAALALLLGGCSDHRRATAAPTTTSAPPTIPPTTTTQPPPILPLTGLSPGSLSQLRRPAVVVKIDNVDAARPQTGINQADVVYEEEVEGGLTRLAAVFQSRYPSVVGPVRSGRLTDEGIADDLNYPVYAYSGTNGIFEPILRSQPDTAVDANNYPSEFYRVGSNVPHNLFADVANLARLSTSHRYPSPLFSFLSAGERFNGAGARPASRLSVGFPAAAVTWSYDAASRSWLRDQNGTEDLDSAGHQASASNVIVMSVNYVVSGMATGEGLPPTPIPDGVLTGSGPVWVFSAGRVVKGTWHRARLTTPATYQDASRATIRLTPGRTWIELVPTGVIPQIR